MKRLKMLLTVLLVVSMAFMMTGCKLGKVAGKTGKVAKAGSGTSKTSYRSAKSGRMISSEERIAFRYIEKLYQEELSDLEKKNLMTRLLPDETLERELKTRGPDAILRSLERERWDDPPLLSKGKRKQPLKRDRVMVNRERRQEFQKPQKLRGMDIYARNDVYIFFPPGTLKPGADGRQTALRKFTMVKLFDGSWRVIDETVVLKHPKKPMTFKQFLKSVHHLKLRPLIHREWVRGDRLL